MEKPEAFAFTCTSDFAEIASRLSSVPRGRLGAIIDSGATRHFCPDRSKFTNFCEGAELITTADGKVVHAIGSGDVQITLPNGDHQSTAILKDALCAPTFSFTLISVSCLMKARCHVSFHDNMCAINYPDPDRRVMATIPESMGLYQLVGRLSKPNGEHAHTALTKMTLFEAHCKLRHIAYLAIRMMVRTGMVEGIILDADSEEEFARHA